jgi:hypothetical protein
MLQMPSESGLRPLMNEAREGPQIGCWQKFRVNTVPRAASLSRFGDFATGSP